MLILGIDPSLTSTGLAMLDTEPAPDRERAGWAVTTVRSEPHTGGHSTAYRRIQTIAREVSEWTHMMSLPDHGPDLVVMEGPAYAKSTGMAHERAGLWWELYGKLQSYGMPITVVLPNLRAKYATGRGNAGKDEVMLAASRRYPHVAITNNNEADAVVLAAMGARGLLEPVEDSLPAAHLAAMKTVAVSA